MLLLLLFLSLIAPPSQAAPVKRPHVEAELVSEALSIRPGLPFWVALRLKMDPEWHTYWVNPGDSGIKTSINWRLPEGFKAGPIEWPYPARLKIPPLVNYGYGDQVLLLTRIDPPVGLTEGRVQISAKADWLVCREVCIPGKAVVEIDLPVRAQDPGVDPDWAPVFAETRKRIPAAADGWRISSQVSKRELRVAAQPPAGLAFRSADDVSFFPLQDGLIENAPEPDVIFSSGRITIDFSRPDNAKADPARVQGVLVVHSSAQAFQVDVPAEPRAASSIWLMILFAFAGGLILNIMPCVFPILSVKILGFVALSNQNPRTIRAHGLVFSLGTLLSFWALAGAIYALRAGGQQLGWGFQLQSPSFVLLLASLFYGMALNLLGFFEVGTTLMGVGGGLASQKSLTGSFFSGVLATVVATPCTAPFMGAALGFALSQHWYIGLLVFTALAFGMLAPYLVFSFAPRLLRFLPRPGRWMESFKQFLAFPLLLTVVWLAWVAGTQVGIGAVIGLLGSIVCYSAGVWVHRRWPARAWSKAATSLLVLLGLAIGWRGAQPDLAASATSGAAMAKAGLELQGMEAEVYSSEKVEELRRAGHPVFVDFTASWCVTCQVNERVVFGTEEVRRRFADQKIRILKGDWTNGDEKITRTLGQYGRSGVPLYLLFPADPSKTALVLPEIITPGIVLEALDQLK